MINIRAAEDRGQADFGWLNSRHTFSFGSYYDPNQMGYSALRVINDDTVAPGAGFSTHGHRDMEIISYVTQGTIEHKDSMGNIQSLPKGEFQLMSAGSGITHSEYNASTTEALKFLQIWIEPATKGGKPSYQQKAFAQAQGLTQVITPNGDNGTLKIKQDASVSQLYLAPKTELILPVALTRKIYIHLIAGQLQVNQQTMNPGDGAKISDQSELTLNNNGQQATIALVFDLP
ncbi:pirin family protein [Catenovulum sp. 2E275]|uniref:pirin family protein n=1 Tax=Catenovulum sp. 2E275 TaxID=2980497 RepID=UPI0021D3E850|nr:pirin family protein [Catenovulum sp. 2E275]MCU4675804.1 pirin family protein [Catenovulum sp. 2E275]